MVRRCGGWYTAGPLGSSRVLVGLTTVLLLGGGPRAAAGVQSSPIEPSPGASVAPAPLPSPGLAEEVSALRDDVGALWQQIDRLTDGETAPRWARDEHERLDRRLEGITTLLERLAARVDKPVPRLSEPLTLITVSLCTLVLGFLAGRSLQRRSSRKDSRFRL